MHPSLSALCVLFQLRTGTDATVLTLPHCYLVFCNSFHFVHHSKCVEAYVKNLRHPVKSIVYPLCRLYSILLIHRLEVVSSVNN